MKFQIKKTHKTFSGKTIFAEHDSEITKTKMNFSYFMPESEKPDQAIIWLSGLTCTEENFMTKAGAQKYLAQHNTLVICPDTSPRGLDLPKEHDNYDFGSGAGFYVNATSPGYSDHYRMYDYIVKEIYSIVESFDVSRVSLTGHSMGGHGALVIGLKEPDLFSHVSAFSPIVNPTQCPWGQKAFSGYLGDNKQLWTDYDACELVNEGSKRNKILIDQGLADEFYEEQLLTSNFETACRDQNQPLQVNYRKGYDHSYYFISTFIKEHIDFLLQK
jgi:S-formylglutathione hydrolase